MKPTAGPRLARAAILDLLAALGFDESRRVTNIWIDPTEITVEFFDVDDLSQRREVKFHTDCVPMTVTMTTTREVAE